MILTKSDECHQLFSLFAPANMIQFQFGNSCASNVTKKLEDNKGLSRG